MVETVGTHCELPQASFHRARPAFLAGCASGWCGPVAGTQLPYLESGVGEWYQFAASHPHAETSQAT
jgi:hypothetical protein